jgi:hypothetical protein
MCINQRDMIAACMALVRAREQARPYYTVHHADGSSHLAQSRGRDIAELDLWWALNPATEEPGAGLAGKEGQRERIRA